MANEIEVWNKVMSAALSMPGVKVNRREFLMSEVRQYCSKDELEKAIKNPVDVLSKEHIDQLADSCISNHLVKVTTISAVMGIPGGFAMMGTIPGDVAQYYWHTFVVAQKLAYLYGFPDLLDENGHLNETAQNMLTLFVGVMMGASVANEAITKVSKAFATQVIKRLPQQALTKTFYYPIIKKIAKWLGIKLTKETFAKGLGKAIPILGGVISGGLTAAAFRPQAKRLKNKLGEQMYDIRSSADAEGAYDNASFEEVDDAEIVDEEKENRATDGAEKVMIKFLINLAKMGNGQSDETESFLSDCIESSTLSEDNQLELAQALSGTEQIKVDFAALNGDDAHAAILLQKGAELLKLQTKVTLAQKLYFKKIAKQLGFSNDEIEEALSETKLNVRQ